jgi:hypothetical protein
LTILELLILVWDLPWGGIARENQLTPRTLRVGQSRSREYFDQDGGNSLRGRGGYLADPADQALAVNSADLIESHLPMFAMERE